MKSSEMLREAAHLVKIKQQFYICSALLHFEILSTTQVYFIRKEILKRLHPCFSLRPWLCDVAKIPDEQLTDKAVRAHRVRWALMLADEYESKGD